MDNKEMLGHERLGKLLFKLAFPAVLAQLVNVLYNIVDRLFIAGLNDDAITSGLSVCFPILMLVAAFSALVGMSGAPLASIELGKGNQDKAEKIMNNSFVMLVIISIILTTIIEIFQEPILIGFGATPTALVHAKKYMTIYMAGTISVLLAMGLNSFIGTQGFSKTSMLSVVIGAVSNIILDATFIIGFNMGIEGAALATIISQTISAIWVVAFLLGKKTMLHLRFKQMKLSPKIFLPILALGVSPFIMQSTESLVQMAFNNGIKKYVLENTDVALAGMGVLFTVMQVISMPMQGLAQGAQPIISFNYGARNMERVKGTFKLLLLSSLTFIGTLYILMMSVPGVFTRPLSPTDEAFEFSSWGLRIFMAGTIMFFLQFSCQQSLVALGQSKVSLFLALFRKVIMLIPLAILLPMFMEEKTFALLLSEPIADVTAAIVTTITFVIVFRKISKQVKASIEKDKKDIGHEGELVTADSDTIDSDDTRSVESQDK